MPGSTRWIPASIAQLPPVHVTRPVRPGGAHELDQRALDAARLEVQIEARAGRGRERQDVREQRRARRVAAVVMRHQLAVAPAPHVHLDHVRAVADGGRERLERVLWRARGVAAMGDAERRGDGAG